MDDTSERGTPRRRAVWFVVWYVVVLLPALGLIALTAWVPAVPGGVLLLAGCVVAGYGTLRIARRVYGGPGDVGTMQVDNPPLVVPGAGRPDQRHELFRTVWSSLRSLGRGLALLAIPAAVTLALGFVLVQQDEVGIGPVGTVAVWVLALVDIALVTVLAVSLLYRVLRLLATVGWAVRVALAGTSGAAEAAPPPGARPGPSGAYWVGVMSVVLFGSLTVMLTALLIDSGWTSWRYHHAPPCSETVTSGCRSLESARVVDIRRVAVGRHQPDEYELTTGDGVRVRVATRPKQWQLHPTDGLMATIERYDGKVLAVSAAGATRRTSEDPDVQMALFVPMVVPALSGLTWYWVAMAARRALTGREAPKRSRRAERLRRIGLAVVIGGLLTFLLNQIRPGLSLQAVLAVQTVATTVALLLLAWRARRRPETP